MWVSGHNLSSGHEFEQAPGVGDGQGGLACCNPQGHKESFMTELLNDNNSVEEKKESERSPKVSEQG